MTDVEIQIDPGSFMTCASGGVTGRIRMMIRSTGDCFPDASWNDFVLITLGWWCEAVANLQALQAAVEIELPFMDGPFSVRVHALADDQVKLEFLRDGADHLGYSIISSVGTLAREVMRASELALSRCDQMSLSGAEIRTLRAKLMALRASI